VTDAYATGPQLRNESSDPPWTDMVSHGEAIRQGYDEQLRYDPNEPTLIVQGLRRHEREGPYAELPWKMGVIRNTPIDR